MSKNILKKCLILIPVAVLIATLFFLNYTVQYFRDTTYTFVYNTNVESVNRFSRELNELSALGYTSDIHTRLFTSLINVYSDTMGDKDAIITFLINEKGQLYHSNDENERHVTAILADEANKSITDGAFAKKSSGEITLKYEGEDVQFYYHWFYAGPNDYCMFMGVEKSQIALKLQTNGVIIPICVIALMLLFTMEYAIWLKILAITEDEEDAKALSEAAAANKSAAKGEMDDHAD
ncbi:MAG: hypothetical protein LBS19_09845 [Clostridiales bacterium]|jgi:hypothetical protein|nr:hypothetical protein [Clostridiales bacterium]